MAESLYRAIKGDGYARFDIRQNRKTKQLFMLDCNPNCSVFYKDLCSADYILQFAGWSKVKFMKFLFEQSLRRQREYHLKHAFTIKYLPQKGFGLYASRSLNKGDLVYTQDNSSLKLITKKYAEQIFDEKEMQTFRENGNYEYRSYQFIFLLIFFLAWPMCDNVYVIWHDDSSTWRSINHSCDPNIWIDGLHYIARRPISKLAYFFSVRSNFCVFTEVDEEITIDYSTYVNEPPDFECWCGVEECRRRLKPNEYKEKWFQDRYGSHVTPYILMLTNIEKMKATLHSNTN